VYSLHIVVTIIAERINPGAAGNSDLTMLIEEKNLYGSIADCSSNRRFVRNETQGLFRANNFQPQRSLVSCFVTDLSKTRKRRSQKEVGILPDCIH
jgi:hypothetical protein